ncbi:MAG: CHASE2 domain-containing protein [Phycisphaerae bacterium]|nr:CHASE2 domain-containing protein [Phycisphaerae bacterium]
MALRQWWVRRGWGLAIGAAVTAAVILAYALGLFDRLSLALLDYGFRHVADIDADPRIVLVDIDDPALERIGRWPWNRRDVADLIDALHECGAGIIAMDIVFAERQAPRLEHPSLSAASVVDPPTTILGDVSLDDAIHDDEELAAAIQRAGNVYLAMFGKLAVPTHHDPNQPLAAGTLLLFDAVVDSAGGVDADAVAPPDSEWGRGFRRIVEALALDFSLDEDAVAKRTGLTVAVVERCMPRARRLTAYYHVRRSRPQNRPSRFEDVLRAVLPSTAADEQSSARAELRLAYDEVLASEAAVNGWGCPDRAVHSAVARAYDVAAPLAELGRAARGVAFVTFEADSVDGVLRHLPLVTVVGHTVVPHLGFAVACDLLRIDLAETTVTPGGKSLEFVNQEGSRRWRVPIGPDGKTLIHWHISSDRPSWDKSFTHVPAARAMEIPLNRRAIRANMDLLALTRARAVMLRFCDQPVAYDDYAQQVFSRNTARREGRPAEGDLETGIKETQRQTEAWLELTRGEIEGLAPEDPDEAAFFEEIRTLHRQLVVGELVREVEAKNVALQKRNEALAEELRAILDGRACFVGYTATALGDIVNSPVFQNMPGVLAHANLLNTMLHDRFPRMSPRGLGMLVIVLGGVLITLLTSRYGPRVSLLGVFVLMGLQLAISGAALRWRDYYVTSTVAALFTVFVSWAFITLYRQVVEQRQRRQIARSLARQTSPAIAAQIARGATEADFAPRPAEVTCYFSDLQGFTSLSEAIGPERTKEVLNRYLGTMSEVLLRHGGSSKFMGDGIFAYFNSPIWACPQHPQAGCEAALACRAALDRLKAAEAGGPNAKEFGSLVMRAGIHTGTVFAGSYGSGERAEYTCIGDTVNLAARLEPANKVFGTTILVSEATYEGVDEDYVFRCLGRLQVKGKTRAVMVYELLGQSNQVDETLRQYAEAFAESIFLFGQRRWDEALRSLDKCARLREGDLALDLYESEIRRLRDDPPPPDWNRAIELTTK